MGDTGGWVEDMASPSLDIGSTVAYALALVAREERKTGRVEARRRDVEGRRAAIVSVGSRNNRYGSKRISGERNNLDSLTSGICFQVSKHQGIDVKMSRCEDIRRLEANAGVRVILINASSWAEAAVTCKSLTDDRW